jgi:hypothetical protein
MLLNGTRNRLDTLGLHVDHTNSVVLRVGDKEITLSIDGETLRLIQTSRTGQTSVTGPA